MTDRDVLQVLQTIRRHVGGNASLTSIAARAGWSAFHLHRAVRQVAGETPKQYELRLRLERAAISLVTGRASIRRIAAETGFASHEVFTRAFRRRFGQTPTSYRALVVQQNSAQARIQHAAVTAAAGPCVTLFHMVVQRNRRPKMPTLSIERREMPAQPILFVRLKTARHEIPSAIAQGVGRVYAHAQKAGLALAGHPFTRYQSTGLGLITIDVGFRFATKVAGGADVEAGELDGGPMVVAIHAGAYEQLGETYAAIERWIEHNGLRAAGPPWEYYVTDPVAHPDPAEWRTEVYWPVAV